MSGLYVCKQYDTPYDERVCAIITTLEEHDKQVRADVIEESINILKGLDTQIVEMFENIVKNAEHYKEQNK